MFNNKYFKISDLISCNVHTGGDDLDAYMFRNLRVTVPSPWIRFFFLRKEGTVIRRLQDPLLVRFLYSLRWKVLTPLEKN